MRIIFAKRSHLPVSYVLCQRVKAVLNLKLSTKPRQCVPLTLFCPSLSNSIIAAIKRWSDHLNVYRPQRKITVNYFRTGATQESILELNWKIGNIPVLCFYKISRLLYHCILFLISHLWLINNI